MPLESLLSLVQTLRERISEHRSTLSRNEMLTRYALVDPLLRELGWDTGDPAIVVPEDTSGQGRADYVLRTNGQPVMVVEAKSLGSGLQNGARQAVDYAMDANRQARYFAITDGQNWVTYDTNRPANDMRVSSFDVMSASPAEACLKAMALWHPAVEHDSVIAAETPLVGLDAVERDVAEPIVPPVQGHEPALQEQSATQRRSAANTQPGERGQQWTPLSQLYNKKGDKPPIEFIFPDNTRSSISSWRSVFIETVQWLQDRNKLNASICPIPRTKERYIIAAEAVHPTGKDFTDPKSIGNLHAEVNYSGPDVVENARIMIKHVGQDPSQFKVRLR